MRTEHRLHIFGRLGNRCVGGSSEEKSSLVYSTLDEAALLTNRPWNKVSIRPERVNVIKLDS